MEAIKCDICGELEEGRGNKLRIHFHDYDVCSKCLAKIDEAIESRKKIE